MYSGVLKWAEFSPLAMLYFLGHFLESAVPLVPTMPYASRHITKSHDQYFTLVMRNGMCNSIAPCADGVVVLVAVRTSQTAAISSWSSYYISVGGNFKLKSNYGYR